MKKVVGGKWFKKTKPPDESGSLFFPTKTNYKKNLYCTVCFLSLLNTSQPLVPFDFSTSL